ncbi:SMEK domain-containing protein [Vibrio parahaemolyticus]|nr:SMEK domain-containing protein [Vibrio parahaemolyticus]ELB2167942.1 SMEK domain-containing protein [Vibrio parahaemolyticus]ELB2188237.1 SMEK domain-containing protein [Vibrio parahaemolyticus]ELB2193487.1 SMEK domain-containing protein [Vibrio parahaemolyticus]ELB2213649.1 SMEK domain-containing protein [Vibrio parahaemolyticus]
MLKEAVNNLNHDISLLELYVKNSQESGFSDMARLLESLSISLFNETYGYKLKNKNQIKCNFPAIDLADDEQNVAVQVTTNADSTKIRHTIKVYEKYNLNKKYKKLYIYGFLKHSDLKDVPDYCVLVNSSKLVSELMDKNDEDAVQSVIDAVKQHTDFSRVHPYDDLNCLKIILRLIDRSAIKHRMHCEGSYDDMVKGLKEITEIISKGKLGKQNKCKSIDDFYDEDIVCFLREVRDIVSRIISIINRSRIDGVDMYNLKFEDLENIDSMKESIINNSNLISKKYHINMVISAH